MPQETTSIKINQVEIVCTNNEGEVLVPIKPICQALGIDEGAQYQLLKDNHLFSKHLKLLKSRSSDGKLYKMLHLPYVYIQLWIIGINVGKVNETSVTKVTALQTEIMRNVILTLEANMDKLALELAI